MMYKSQFPKMYTWDWFCGPGSHGLVFPSVDPLTERTVYGSRASVSEQTVVWMEYQSVKQNARNP